MASCAMHTIHLSVIVLLAVTYMHVPATAIIIVPSSNCYTFDNESRLVDFTHLVGKVFEYKEQGLLPSDLVVEFCKDVQKRSQEKMHNGDLVHCETTLKKMGCTAQVNIICGHCSNKMCKDEQGCICSISYHERMCSFQTEQIHVSLHLSAKSSLSGLVGKPTFKVNPVKGLGVTLVGFNGAMPSALSPTVLNVDWRCEIARTSPYEFNIFIPVEGYDPIEFTLTKKCG